MTSVISSKGTKNSVKPSNKDFFLALFLNLFSFNSIHLFTFFKGYFYYFLLPFSTSLLFRNFVACFRLKITMQNYKLYLY